MSSFSNIEVRPATTRDAKAIAEIQASSSLAAYKGLLSDEQVSAPIYDLPRPISEDSVTRWVTEGQAQALAGEALLIVSLDPAGAVSGYSRVTVWPDRSAAELAGAMRADLQNSGSFPRPLAAAFSSAIGLNLGGEDHVETPSCLLISGRRICAS